MHVRSQCLVSPLLAPLKMVFSESNRPAWQDEAAPSPLPSPEMCDSLGKSDPGALSYCECGVC